MSVQHTMPLAHALSQLGLMLLWDPPGANGSGGARPGAFVDHRGWPVAAMRDRIEAWTWSPELDVFERHETLVVRMDLPGMPSSDIRVEISGDEITVSGERTPESHERGDNWHHAGRAYGRFVRAVPLPAGAWPEQARATFGDGVLEIAVPVSAQGTCGAPGPTVETMELQVSARSAA